MPKAELPTNLRGWMAALVASFVGFVSGFVVLRAINKAGWK